MFILNVSLNIEGLNKLFITKWAHSFEIVHFLLFKSSKLLLSFSFVFVPRLFTKSAFFMVFKVITVMKEKIPFTFAATERNSRKFNDITFLEKTFIKTKFFRTFD